MQLKEDCYCSKSKLIVVYVTRVAALVSYLLLFESFHLGPLLLLFVLISPQRVASHSGNLVSTAIGPICTIERVRPWSNSTRWSMEVECTLPFDHHLSCTIIDYHRISFNLNLFKIFMVLNDSFFSFDHMYDTVVQDSLGRFNYLRLSCTI